MTAGIVIALALLTSTSGNTFADPVVVTAPYPHHRASVTLTEPTTAEKATAYAALCAAVEASQAEDVKRFAQMDKETRTAVQVLTEAADKAPDNMTAQAKATYAAAQPKEADARLRVAQDAAAEEPSIIDIQAAQLIRAGKAWEIKNKGARQKAIQEELAEARVTDGLEAQRRRALTPAEQAAEDAQRAIDRAQTDWDIWRLTHQQ